LGVLGSTLPAGGPAVRPFSTLGYAAPRICFLDSWRHELLTRAWEALGRARGQTDQPLYAALRLRADQPDLDSAGLAERLSARLGQPVTANWLRQLLYRARKEFADFLLDDVIQSLDSPTAEQLGQELLDLGLYEYCRPALERRGPAL
jgi:hypothetical protein